MSFPPATEMFQFAGFASRTYGFSAGYRQGRPWAVGCPIRRPRDHRSLASPPGFSQRAASFIASQCQGIHQMPFSTPTSGVSHKTPLPGIRNQDPGARKTGSADPGPSPRHP